MGSGRGGDDDEGLKGNRKGKTAWTFVKNASLLVTVFLFFFTIVLVLDAYKFVSVRHAKFARKKLLRTLQYMDPSIIEAHTGMKVLTNEEFKKLQTDLESARKQVREMNTKVQEKFSEVLKASMELQNMKQDIEELKGLIAEKEKEQKEAPPPPAPEPEPAAAAPAEGEAAPAEGEAAAEEPAAAEAAA